MCSVACASASGSRFAQRREEPMRVAPQVVRRSCLVLLLALWELVPRLGLLPELFLPSLTKTLTVLAGNWQEYGHALMVTLYEVALAMVIACSPGILVGALLGGFSLLR